MREAYSWRCGGPAQLAALVRRLIQTMFNVIETDVLIFGGGGAGSRAAIEAYDHGATVIMAVKGRVGHSGCTPYVGTNAAVGPWGDETDRPEYAMRDLLAHGGFLGHQELVKILAEDSADRIMELHDWGAEFERNEDGSFAILHAAAHSYGRNVTLRPSNPNPQKDGYLPGIAVMDALRDQLAKRDVRIMEDVVLVDLLKSGGRVVGATAIDCAASEFLVFKAKSTVLATGTYSHVFSHTSVSLFETGDGQAAAFRAGAELIDMENTQYIPTRTGLPPGSVLVNANGERFLERYGVSEGVRNAKEVTVHAIGTEIREGRGPISVDVVDTTKRDEWNPEYWDRLGEVGSLYPGYMDNGVDTTAGRFETGPLAHTTTGGVRINDRCEASIPGLYAAGAVAGGVYGHARPEGFTVQITLVLGRRAGQLAAEGAKLVGEVSIDDASIQASLDRAVAVYDVIMENGVEQTRSQVQDTMYKHAWVVKDQAGLEEGLRVMKDIAAANRPVSTNASDMPEDGFEWARALEASNLLLTAELMLTGAIERKESRGAFFRADYPETDHENWLRNIVYRQIDGGIATETVPVDLRYCGPNDDRAVPPHWPPADGRVRTMPALSQAGADD